MKKINVLNLYAGIGGNRKNWTAVNVTAVEYNEEIAAIYSDLHPEDEVIVGDAHQFLEKNWDKYDIIWSSPPCQSHSKVRMMASKGGSYDAVMPDMKLWSEILFLKHFRGKRPWVVENVKPYYEPFVEPTQKLGRHMFWCNFNLPYEKIEDGLTHNERGSSKKGFFDLSGYKIKHRKDQIIRNCVNPELGSYVPGHALEHLKLLNQKQV
jgi:DNA (cytosine-5)-methyltransferase 1